MRKRKLTPERIAAYAQHLYAEECAPGTVEKYLRDIRAFAAWLDGGAVTREAVTKWKEQLQAGKAAVTVNGALAALNSLFRFQGWEDCRARFLKVQRRLFRDSTRKLKRGDYERLIATARERGQERLVLLLDRLGLVS